MRAVRTVLLAVALLALPAAPAAADIQLIDPASGAATTLVKDDFTRLIGRVGDGFLVDECATGGPARVGARRLRRARAPEFNRARTSIGPGGQTISSGCRRLRAARARTAAWSATHPLGPRSSSMHRSRGRPTGRGVAVLDDDRLRVVDTTTGAAGPA